MPARQAGIGKTRTTTASIRRYKSGYGCKSAYLLTA
jgi:hypothetical protein